MLRNYFLTAWRNLLRNRIYSLINLLGLATGVACCLLIGIYVWHEYSYDRFHPDLDQLYVVCQESSENPGYRWNNTAPIMGEMLIKDIPEVQEMVRMHSKGGLVRVGEGDQSETYQLDGIQYVDSNFFSLFGFELLEGNPEEVFNQPNQVVLPQSLAQKLYGSEEVIGKHLQVDDRWTLQVSGVMADVPDNSSIDFDMLVSWTTLGSVYGGLNFNSWWWPPTQVYVRLHPQAPLAELNHTRLPDFVAQYREANNTLVPSFQPLADLHLHGVSDTDEGAMRYVSLFSLVAIIILLIACINFMNLSTARSARRAREVGVRKVVGASRGMLIQQFLGESFLVTSMAVLLGLGLAELFIPLFNNLAGMDLSIPWQEGRLWLGILTLTALIGFLAGSYPAVFLSQFRPIQVIKASLNLKVSGSGLRRGLVVAQFVISISLIICTIIIWQQHQYMLTKSLGFDKTQLINVSMKNIQDRHRLEVLEANFEAIPGVERATPASWAGSAWYMIQFPVEVADANGQMQALEWGNIVYTDYDWLQTIGVDLVAGRNFSEEFSTDIDQAFLVNESMLRYLNDSSLIGRNARMYYSEFGEVLYEKKGQIVGVFKDFHTEDLHSEITPLMVALANPSEVGNYLTNVAVRLRPGDHREQLAALQTAWQETFPNQPFDYVFVEDRLREAYEQEEQLGQILTAFTVLAIFIALLGLLGLAAFTAQQRTKEMGVRKILGASKQHILLLLNREFTWLVLIALLLSVPLAFWLMQGWLEEYPYRIEISVLPYAVAGLSALLLTWLTVSIHSLRAAWRNPADALRDE